MRALRILAAVAGGVLGLVVLLFVFLQTPPGQRALAAVVSGEQPESVGRERLLPDRPSASSASSFSTGRGRGCASSRRACAGRSPRCSKAACASRTCRRPRSTSSARPSRSRRQRASRAAASACRWASTCRPSRSTRFIWRRASGRRRVALEAARQWPCCPPTCTRAACASAAIAPTGRRAGFRPTSASTPPGSPSTARSRSRRARAAWWRRCCSGPISSRSALKLTAKGDAASGNGRTHRVGRRCRHRQGHGALAAGRQAQRHVRAAFPCSSRRAARSWPSRGGPVSLAAEATVDERAAILRESTLAAGPARSRRRAATTARPIGSTATATLQSDEPGPLAPLLGGVGWRGLRLTAHAVLENLAKQPQGSVTLSGSAEDLTVAGARGPPAAARTGRRSRASSACRPTAGSRSTRST